MFSSLYARARSFWAGLTRSGAVDAEMDEEFRLHIDLRAADLVRQGLPPDEAARMALVEFGKTDHRRQDGRRARGLGFFEELRFSWIDVKLGARMLVKYPGLTFVGGLGIAVAIAFSTTSFALSSGLFAGLPLDEGDRIVSIEYHDARWSRAEPRIVHDFEAWRRELKSVQDIGAGRSMQRNLVTGNGRAEPVSIAEMSASGFRVTRVPAALGRPLIESDETEGAPPVLVIGHDVWRTRFGSDSAIVGREVRLGGTIHTIVGVMPPGFGFPMAHQYWTALRLDASEYERRQGPALQVFGRLASQATLASAQAELAAYSQRMASEHPRTHKDLRARVMPYQDAFNEREHSLQFALIQLLIVMLLGVVCTNVATLVYARTAARYSEIAVRSALGASRPRIVGHLFAEGLVLSMAATVVGLLISKVTIDQINTLLVGFEVAVPFWMRFHLSFGTMVYAVLLAAFASVVVGVTPALKATGRHVNASLQRISSGALGLQLGRTWTALIVAQAAFSVAAIPLPIYYARVFMEYGTANPGYRSNDFLLFRLRMDRDAPTVATAATYDREYTARFRARAGDLVRRLEAEPGVTHVIHLSGVPGTASQVNIEVEGATTSMTGTTRVDIGFFEALGVPVVSGRVFSAADAGIAAGGEWRDGDGDGLAEYSPGPPVSSDAVMVNRSFVNEVLHGTNPLGRRLRYSGQVDDGQSTAPEVWYQIVGVVNDYPAVPMELDSPRAMVYHPIADGESVELMAIRLAGVPPSSFGERLRQITATVDPSLRLTDIRPLDVALREGHFALRMGAFGIVIVTMSVLLLAAAGIYALMSFTVERRRREIGIRVALGADRTRVVRGVFGRALRQLAIGVGVGAAIAPLILRLDGPITSQKIATLVAVSGGLLLVGVLALVGPTRRTLRIQPTEALREG